MSIYFNGSSYISLGEPSVLDFDPESEFTITCWAFVSAGASGTFVGKRYLSTAIQYQLGVNASGHIFVRLGGSDSEGTVDVRGAWHHFALVSYYTAPNWLNIGLVDAGLTDELSPDSSGTQSGTAHTLFGARRTTNNTNYGFPLTGTIEDIRFYNRALSRWEIETIYACRGSDKINYGLVGKYLLNEGYPVQTVTGTGIVKDISNEKNNGTATGSPTYDDTITLKRF